MHNEVKVEVNLWALHIYYVVSTRMRIILSCRCSTVVPSTQVDWFMFFIHEICTALFIQVFESESGGATLVLGIIGKLMKWCKQ